MAQLTRAAWAAVAFAVSLAVVAPVVVCLVDALFLPAAVLVTLICLGRLVWYYTAR